MSENGIDFVALASRLKMQPQYTVQDREEILKVVDEADRLQRELYDAILKRNEFRTAYMGSQAEVRRLEAVLRDKGIKA